MQLNYPVPISTGVIYMLTMIVSLVVYKDPITAYKLIGVGLVLGGIILMNVKKLMIWRYILNRGALYK